MQTMSEALIHAVRYHHTGEPPEVVQIDALPPSDPGQGEVRVRMLFAPVNPADLNMLEGKYGEQRPLPDVPGNEGCGQVVAVGAGVDASWVGRLVLVDSEAWREEGNWKADDLVPVPAGLEARAACVLRVNPPTAWRLLRDFADLRTGDWIAQNAAASAVGRAVVEIAAHFGWKTLNVVRRPEVADELRALGADAVLVDGDELAAQASFVLAGAKPRLALNAVGGASATSLAAMLVPGGTLVTYGAMSKEALKIPNGFLIFRDLVFRGFWLTRWLREAVPGDRDAMFGEIFRLAAAGCFAPRVAADFPLKDVSSAVSRAMQGGGKVLLRMNA